MLQDNDRSILQLRQVEVPKIFAPNCQLQMQFTALCQTLHNDRCLPVETSAEGGGGVRTNMTTAPQGQHNPHVRRKEQIQERHKDCSAVLPQACFVSIRDTAKFVKHCATIVTAQLRLLQEEVGSCDQHGNHATTSVTPQCRRRKQLKNVTKIIRQCCHWRVSCLDGLRFVSGTLRKTHETCRIAVAFVCTTMRRQWCRVSPVLFCVMVMSRLMILVSEGWPDNWALDDTRSCATDGCRGIGSSVTDISSHGNVVGAEWTFYCRFVVVQS